MLWLGLPIDFLKLTVTRVKNILSPFVIVCLYTYFSCGYSVSGLCTPYVIKFISLEYEKASACKVTRSTNGMYVAKLNGCDYRVNLKKMTCTCMKLKITGIPCGTCIWNDSSEKACTRRLFLSLVPDCYLEEELH